MLLFLLFRQCLPVCLEISCLLSFGSTSIVVTRFIFSILKIQFQRWEYFPPIDLGKQLRGSPLKFSKRKGVKKRRRIKRRTEERGVKEREDMLG